MNNAHMRALVHVENRRSGPMSAVIPFVCSTLLVVACGCDKSDKKPSRSAAAPSASIEPLPSVAAPAPPAPQDIDVGALEKELNCQKTGPKQACRILKEFASAQRFTAHTPSGEGRWVGHSFTVDKGVESERQLIFWSKSVPTSQVGPGDLPVKVGFDFFPDELKAHAEKLVRTLGRGDPPSPKNQAFPYAKVYVPTKQRVIVNTAGPSVHVTAEESIYIRAKQLRFVYIVNPSTSRESATGDGLYAELWLADW